MPKKTTKYQIQLKNECPKMARKMTKSRKKSPKATGEIKSPPDRSAVVHSALVVVSGYAENDKFQNQHKKD